MLTLHVMVALSSLAVTGFTFLKPSSGRLRLSQALIALTLASGTYLVLTLNVNLLRVCAVGLVYTAVTVYGLTQARGKLLAQESSAGTQDRSE